MPELWRLLDRTASSIDYTLLDLPGIKAAILKAGVTPEVVAGLPERTNCVVTPAANLVNDETGELNEEIISILAERNVGFLVVDSYFQIDREDKKSYAFDGPMPDWLNALISIDLFDITLVQSIVGDAIDAMFRDVEMGDHRYNICDFRLPLVTMLERAGAVALPPRAASARSSLAFGGITGGFIDVGPNGEILTPPETGEVLTPPSSSPPSPQG